jgi:hypothetical protein
MLAQIGVNRFNFIYSNVGTALTPGTSVTPGASDVEGSPYLEIASGANLSQDIYLMTIWVSDGATANNVKSHLLDIGVDPAGGTSWSAVVSNIVCGQSAPHAVGGGLCVTIPLFIKSGSSVAVRVQGSNATAGTVLVTGTFYGQPSHPELIRTGQYAETIGTITGSQGVSFTPGNSGAEGTWVSLGTLTRPCWWFQLCPQVSQSTVTGQAYHLDLAYGDGSNKHIIIQDLRIVGSTTEELRFTGPISQGLGFADLPAGAELWVRGACSGSSISGWNAVAIGIGG